MSYISTSNAIGYKLLNKCHYANKKGTVKFKYSDICQETAYIKCNGHNTLKTY